MTEILVRIVSSYFCAGVVVGEKAAPIVNYMRNWSIEDILAYCKKKGWKAEVICVKKLP